MAMLAARALTRVLVIDDNPIDRDLYRRLLQNQPARGFQCVEGKDGRTGLEQFRRERPDCVILDLNLPDIDGLELLRSLLTGADHPPVIVATAYGSEQVAVQAMKGGAADYLAKGTTTGEGLARIIEKAIEKHALLLQVEQQRLAIEERNRELEAALARERAARSAVQESENRYRTLAEAMPQVVWTAAHPTGEMDYINERWSRLTGTSPDSALGHKWLDFIVPEDQAHVREVWEAALASTHPLEVDCRMQAAGQTARWQLTRALPLLEDGQPVKWLGTFTDIEDQRRAEQLFNQRQKLESIGILAGGVAHDFNNLLVGIVGGTSYALDVLPPTHELTPVLELAFKSSERAAHLTRQLLAYAGKGRFLVESIDLSQLLQTTSELIQASIPKSVELKLLTRPDLPHVESDASQLQQIVMNLIINAAEAIPPEREGFVIVRTDLQHIQSPRTTWTGDLRPGDYVVLEVRDNGSGIEPAVLNQIFDPFFTTKFTGRGLGLAAVHGILRSNKGAIEVESTPGKGSTFRVLLPPARTPAPEAMVTARPATNPPKGRILVVDDEPIVRSTAKLALEGDGHTVEVVASGQQALDILSRPGEHFSLVLLDLSMPGLDGGRTFDAIRRSHPDLPVVLCSGYSEAEIRRKFAGTTISGFLQKPFHRRTICDKVAQLLDVQ